MKLKYQAPAIEVLRVEDTAVCDDVNYFNGIPVEKNCGGMMIMGKFKVTAPAICTHTDVVIGS